MMNIAGGCSLKNANHSVFGEVPVLPTLKIAAPRFHLLAAAPLLSALLLLPLGAHGQPVHAWEGAMTIPTYELGPPDPNPPFSLVNEHPIYPYPMLDDLPDSEDTSTPSMTSSIIARCSIATTSSSTDSSVREAHGSPGGWSSASPSPTPPILCPPSPPRFITIRMAVPPPSSALSTGFQTCTGRSQSRSGQGRRRT